MKLLNIKYYLLAVVLLQTVACKKDYTDPSKATPDESLTTSQGMTNTAIGLQRVYTFGRAGILYNLVTTDGFTTKQLNILNQGNTAEAQLYSGGGTVDATNTVLENLWTYNNKVIFDANNILNNAPELADKAYASGLIAYASIFKALALGNLAMFWDHIPDTSGEDVEFITSKAGFTKAVTIIDNALTAINADPISASFLAKLPVGVDVVNTLYALKARYALFAENYTAAMDAVNKVDLTKKSTFNFDNLALNPIWETAASNVNVYQPIDTTMGLPVALEPALSDKRVPFYISISATQYRYRINGFAGLSTTAWPIYLPGEIRLIKAEVHVRNNQIPDAIVTLNSVRTKTPAQDPFGVGADQPVYTGGLSQAALLEEIYKQRAIELYMSGLRLADQRRLGRAASERKRTWMPYPFVERDNNPNTPADPPN
jgi:starch-binding outer membrane protein, SusD/RagB family